MSDIVWRQQRINGPDGAYYKWVCIVKGSAEYKRVKNAGRKIYTDAEYRRMRQNNPRSKVQEHVGPCEGAEGGGVSGRGYISPPLPLPPVQEHVRIIKARTPAEEQAIHAKMFELRGQAPAGVVCKGGKCYRVQPQAAAPVVYGPDRIPAPPPGRGGLRVVNATTYRQYARHVGKGMPIYVNYEGGTIPPLPSYFKGRNVVFIELGSPDSEEYEEENAGIAAPQIVAGLLDGRWRYGFVLHAVVSPYNI